MQKSFVDELESIAPIDAVILAIAQIVQPAFKDDIYEAVKGSHAGSELDEVSFRDHFRVLERAKLFWRTDDKKYVVTTTGDALARRSMNSKTRDKIRLLLLNKKRHSND
jgi:hypothetical protein